MISRLTAKEQIRLEKIKARIAMWQLYYSLKVECEKERISLCELEKKYKAFD